MLYRLLTLLFRSGGGLWNNHDFHGLDGGAVVAFLISGLWMVHPVHSAAMDYISGRADSLAFLFSAGAWLLVLRGRGVNSRWLKGGIYFAAALGGLLGLCSREIACIWIFVFLVHTLAFAPDMRRRAKIFSVICCALVLCAYDGLRRLPPVASRKRLSPKTGRPSVRGTLMLRALGDYGRLMVFPCEPAHGAHAFSIRTITRPRKLAQNSCIRILLDSRSGCSGGVHLWLRKAWKWSDERESWARSGFSPPISGLEYRAAQRDSGGALALSAKRRLLAFPRRLRLDLPRRVRSWFNRDRAFRNFRFKRPQRASAAVTGATRRSFTSAR